MNLNQKQGIINLLVSVGAGFLVEHGIMQASQAQDFIGGAIALGAFLWNLYHHSSKGPGPAAGAKVAAAAHTDD